MQIKEKINELIEALDGITLKSLKDENDAVLDELFNLRATIDDYLRLLAKDKVWVRRNLK